MELLGTRTPKEQRDSYAGFYVRIAMSAFDSFEVVDLPVQSNDVLQSLSIEQPGVGAWLGSLELFDVDRKLHDNLALVPHGRKRVEVSFGWHTNNEEQKPPPTYKGMLTKIEPQYAVEGVSIAIDFVYAGASGGDGKGADMVTAGPRQFYRLSDEQAQTQAEAPVDDADASADGEQDSDDPHAPVPSVDFTPIGLTPAEWTPTHVLQRLAEYWGWDLDAVATAPFPDDIENLNIPVGQTAYDWVIRTLVPMSMTPDSTPMMFYSAVDSGRWRFVPKGAPQPFVTGETDADAPEDHAVKRSYIVHRDSMGDVYEFSPTDNTYMQATAGGFSAYFHGVDSENGTPITHAAEPATGVQENDTTHAHVETGTGTPATVPDVTAVADVTPSNSETHVSLPVPGRSALTTFHRSSLHHNVARSVNQQATLRVKGTHDITNGDLLEVVYADHRTERKHPLSGIYMVIRVKHAVDGSGWSTEFELHRHGGNDYFESIALAQLERDLVDPYRIMLETVLSFFKGLSGLLDLLNPFA